MPESAERLGLQEDHAEIERYRIKPAGKDDACTATFCGFTQLADFGGHPGRLTTQVHIICSLPGACIHQYIAVTLIRTDRRDHQPGLPDELPDRYRIGGLSNQQRQGLRRTDGRPDSLQLFETAPSHGPAQRLCSRIKGLQVLGNETTGISGCAKQNNIEVHQQIDPWFVQLEP